MDTQDAKNLTEQAGRSDVVRTGARIGHAANGLLHLIVAYLIAQLALGSSQEDTDQSGALSLLGQSTLGAVLLWVVIAGLVLLAVWQITEAVTLSKTSKRISAAGKAVVYLVIAGVAFFIAIGSSTSSGTEEEATGTALSMPGGQFLVAIAAIVILAIGWLPHLQWRDGEVPRGSRQESARAADGRGPDRLHRQGDRAARDGLAVWFCRVAARCRGSRRAGRRDRKAAGAPLRDDHLARDRRRLRRLWHLQLRQGEVRQGLARSLLGRVGAGAEAVVGEDLLSALG